MNLIWGCNMHTEMEVERVKKEEKIMKFPSAGLIWISIPQCHSLNDSIRDVKFPSLLI